VVVRRFPSRAAFPAGVLRRIQFDPRGFAIMHALRIFLIAAILLPALPAQAQQAVGPALPAIPQLMKEVREHQKALDKVRENYTFTRLITVEEMDSKGKVTKTEGQEYEVFFVHGHGIARMVKKDGKPLTDEEQKKETERVTKAVEKAENPPPEPHKEGQNINMLHILAVADARNPRRENFRGRSTLIYDFVGRKDLKAQGLSEDLSKKLQGTIWIDETDRQVARLEAAIIDNFHLGGGVLINIQKGSRFIFDQALVNGEIWLPSSTEGTVQARVLLVKGVHQHFTERDYDYKRFHAEAQQGKGAKVVPENKQ
jgi:hypothetical protein